MTVISGRVHRDNLADYYRLLTEAMLSPAFLQDDLERLKSEVLDYLENTLRYASDEELGKAVLYNEIFAGTPYGHIPAGTVEAVQSITLDDVRSSTARTTRETTWSSAWAADTMPSCCSGCGRNWAACRPDSRPRSRRRRRNPIHGLRVTIVEKDANATAISMGYPIDLLRGARDWYALAVANSWLGEHRNTSSHLFQVIREQRGLNYGDYSYIEHFPNGGC